MQGYTVILYFLVEKKRITCTGYNVHTHTIIVIIAHNGYISHALNFRILTTCPNIKGTKLNYLCVCKLYPAPVIRYFFELKIFHQLKE